MTRKNKPRFKPGQLVRYSKEWQEMWRHPVWKFDFSSPARLCMIIHADDGTVEQPLYRILIGAKLYWISGDQLSIFPRTNLASL